MKVIRLLLPCVCLMLFISTTSRAKEWRGIVPLHSTRADVERLIGKPNSKYDLYDFEHERVSIIYSNGPCTRGLQGMWNVPRDTVIRISVAPKEGLQLSDLRIDLRKYERIKDPHVQAHTIYSNKEEGITYHVSEGGKDSGRILEINYEPSSKDNHLRCPCDSVRQVDCVPSGRWLDIMPESSSHRTARTRLF